MPDSRPKTFFRTLLQPYVVRTYLIMGALQLICFYPTRLLLPYLPAYDMTGPLDEMIPFIPAWVLVYVASFPFWIFTKIWVLSESREHAYRFCASYVLALVITAAAFLLYPGTMVRPEVTGTGFFDWAVRLIYSLDTPTNLCPSLHVLATYYCWRGSWGCRKIPQWYKAFSFIFLLGVCACVLFVKQHAVIDVPAAVLVGELTLQCGRLFRIERVPFAVQSLFHRGNKQ